MVNLALLLLFSYAFSFFIYLLEATPRKDIDDENGPNFILLYAHNGTGKTRASMEFKDKGKRANNGVRDTLYFNAFTEDLFVWDNDLDDDTNRHITLNSTSAFFSGFKDLALEPRILNYLERYATFEFKFDYEKWKVNFEQEVKNSKYHPNNHELEFVKEANIKISRGEESIFK